MHGIVGLAIFCSAICSVSAQDSAGTSPAYGVVDTVIVIGNKKTKDDVILREMTIKPGSIATVSEIEFDRSRIYSLGLFNSVDIFYDTLEGQRMLIVSVSERWYIIPLPLFGFRDGDPKKPYYGIGILHNNFRGLNQKVLASIVFGYDPSLSLFFSDPQIDKTNDLFFSGHLSYSRVKNKSKRESALTGDFNEDHYDINATLGKRFTLYESSGFTLGYQIVRVSDFRPGRTASPDGTDRFVYAGAYYTLDSRDLRDYPTHGRFLSLYVTKYGLGESIVSFTKIGGDFRIFLPLPADLTFATRIHGATLLGSIIPTYSHVFFGYSDKIRGYFKTVFEGENIFGTSVELRFPLLKSRTIVVSALPLPPEFSVWRFGISLALFADAGTTWYHGEKVTPNSFASGYGGGVHFLLPYDVVARTEYAWNNFGNGQFIFDVRASF